MAITIQTRSRTVKIDSAPEGGFREEDPSEDEDYEPSAGEEESEDEHEEAEEQKRKRKKSSTTSKDQTQKKTKNDNIDNNKDDEQQDSKSSSSSFQQDLKSKSLDELMQLSSSSSSSTTKESSSPNQNNKKDSESSSSSSNKVADTTTSSTTKIEVVEFAGEKIERVVNITPVSPKKSFAPARPFSAQKKGALDGILSGLSGNNKPKKLSTLEKSQLDWEKFKDTNVMEKNDLEKQSKNGYLEKQAFLQRTDENLYNTVKSLQKKQ
ncbi:hypothetical protein DFA_00046 [Cavenderia fasciculata]|uniref:BCNT-C domain-containing protein n=1 Tax=Cavenderia fasciculata TaxID=261658 RepID=F4PXF9_CACFS|nr:uncharacterized protein DFA_00046 [Cavenderia fasciculata]EGG19469.1 hypothetical protein DFA_00046 [Cavenderia fasciculata]|eukprot:XP_004357763.1 hypothetical protein DFA_00046 [Cavenderia fasciculata]